MTTSSNLAKNAEPQDKLLFLDGIRGFSALWVLLSHALAYIGWTSIPILNNGGLAVDVFMIMSGFLMSFHYYRRRDVEAWNSPETWRNFYVRRFFRIAPLYYILLIFSFVFNDFFAYYRESIDKTFPLESLAVKYGSPSNFFDYKYMGATASNIFLHITFLFGLIPEYATSTPLPDWSIGLEVQFYALFPFIMLAFKKLENFWAPVLFLGAGYFFEKVLKVVDIAPPGFSEPFPLPSFLFLKIEFFLIGILLASACFYRSRKPTVAVWSAGFAVVLSAYKGGPIILFLMTLISLFLFYDKLNDPLRIQRVISLPEGILSCKLATFMADTSYSVYLTHTLIMAPFAAFLITFPGYVSLPGPMRFVLLSLPVVPLTYSISWLLFNYIEKPGILLGKNFLNVFKPSSSKLRG